MSLFFSSCKIKQQQNRDVDVEKGINGETEFFPDCSIFENAKEDENPGQILDEVNGT